MFLYLLNVADNSLFFREIKVKTICLFGNHTPIRESILTTFIEQYFFPLNKALKQGEHYYSKEEVAGGQLSRINMVNITIQNYWQQAVNVSRTRVRKYIHLITTISNSNFLHIQLQNFKNIFIFLRSTLSRSSNCVYFLSNSHQNFRKTVFENKEMQFETFFFFHQCYKSKILYKNSSTNLY